MNTHQIGNMTTQQSTKSNMTEKYLTPDELNARLDETRDQKFRKKSQKQIDQINLLKELNNIKRQDPYWQKKWKKDRAGNPKWVANQKQSALARSKDPIWQQKQKEGILKKRQDPEWQKNQILGFKKRSNNAKWKKNHKEALQKLAKDPNWIEKKRQIHSLARGTKCQVKEPNQAWQTFNSFNEAARHYKWNNLSTHPDGTFPLDGSIKQWVAGKHKGWQTRRIIND